MHILIALHSEYKNQNSSNQGLAKRNAVDGSIISKVSKWKTYLLNPTFIYLTHLSSLSGNL